MAKLDGKTLRELRNELGLTQRDLADRANIDPGTIHRLETGSRGGKTRSSTVRKLSAALNVSEAVLTGAATRAKARNQGQSAEIEAARAQLNLRIDNGARNALALVASRYKVTPAQIIEIAPFLFYLAAERSLKARRRKLSAVWKAVEQLEQVRNGIRNLPRSDYGDEDALFAEDKSINAADVFGRIVGQAPIHFRDNGEDNVNPFVNFLREEMAELADAKLSVSWWDDSGSPEYRICIADAAEIVGGDATAATLILYGIVPLHEMPREIRGGSPEERAQWVRTRHEQAQKDIPELLEFSVLDLLENSSKAIDAAAPTGEARHNGNQS